MAAVVIERPTGVRDTLRVVSPDQRPRHILTLGSNELAETQRRVNEWKSLDPNIDTGFLLRQLAYSKKPLASRIQAGHRLVALRVLDGMGYTPEAVGGVNVSETGPTGERRLQYTIIPKEPSK